MMAGAIIVAGGAGVRAGGERPKQLQKLGDLPVFTWSLRALLRHTQIDRVVLVRPLQDAHLYQDYISEKVIVADGGATRTQSVKNGLAALKFSDADIVLIHDAARPGLSHGIVSELLEALNTADASAPALKVSDALKRQVGPKLTTVNRDELYRVQTPQAFRYGQICAALADGKASYVDDLEAIEACGGSVNLISGSEHLAKITYPGDLQRMAQILSPRQAGPRVGSGYDVHAFAVGDQITLCGVSIAHTQALAGHSDADVAWHALTDAILGAAALGDIGDHFPPSDPQWQGADSALFLRHALELANQAGFALQTCDITIICETPKVKPHREAMRARTADILSVDISAVSIKATTTEGLGFTGRGEGIAAQAIAVLSPCASHA